MIRKLKKDNGSPGWTRLDVLAGPSQMTTSERHPGLTLQERPDAVPGDFPAKRRHDNF